MPLVASSRLTLNAFAAGQSRFLRRLQQRLRRFLPHRQLSSTGKRSRCTFQGKLGPAKNQPHPRSATKPGFLQSAPCYPLLEERLAGHLRSLICRMMLVPLRILSTVIPPKQVAIGRRDFRPLNHRPARRGFYRQFYRESGLPGVHNDSCRPPGPGDRVSAGTLSAGRRPAHADHLPITHYRAVPPVSCRANGSYIRILAAQCCLL